MYTWYWKSIPSNFVKFLLFCHKFCAVSLKRGIVFLYTFAKPLFYPQRTLFWFFFGVQKRTKPCYRSCITSDEKIFRVLTGSCRGGIMESRRGEKTYSIYPPSAKPKHHRDKVQSIPAVVAEERSGTTASHRKIFSSDDTRLNVPPTLHVR